MILICTVLKITYEYGKKMVNNNQPYIASVDSPFDYGSDSEYSQSKFYLN